jgi:hypothetical protein
LAPTLLYLNFSIGLAQRIIDAAQERVPSSKLDKFKRIFSDIEMDVRLSAFASGEGA